MSACSSIRFPSPMTIGPASAMMRALGWITVRGPAGTARRHPAPAPAKRPGLGPGDRALTDGHVPADLALHAHHGARRDLHAAGSNGAVTGVPPTNGEGTPRPGVAVAGGSGRNREDRGRSGTHSPLLRLLRHGRGRRRLRGAGLRGCAARPGPRRSPGTPGSPGPPQVRKGARLRRTPGQRERVPCLEAQGASCLFMLEKQTPSRNRETDPCLGAPRSFGPL